MTTGFCALMADVNASRPTRLAVSSASRRGDAVGCHTGLTSDPARCRNNGRRRGSRWRHGLRAYAVASQCGRPRALLCCHDFRWLGLPLKDRTLGSRSGRRDRKTGCAVSCRPAILALDPASALHFAPAPLPLSPFQSSPALTMRRLSPPDPFSCFRSHLDRSEDNGTGWLPRRGALPPGVTSAWRRTGPREVMVEFPLPCSRWLRGRRWRS